MLCFTLSTYFDSEILTLLLIEILTLLFYVETCILTLYFRCGTNVACHFWNGFKYIMPKCNSLFPLSIVV